MLPYKNKNLPLEQRVLDLISRLTTDEKISQLPTRQEGIPRLCIKEYRVGGEGAHGVVIRTGGVSTVFPQPIALSCTWDTELMQRIGSAIGDEARVYYNKTGKTGGLTLWFPTIDMERDSRWGRNEEAYGEDPYLTGKLSAAMIRGAQGEDPFYVKIAAAPKHFYANNTENERTTVSSVVNKRCKHEYYLKAFSYAFKEGKSLSMMSAYNEINGRPCILNDEIQKIVKDEWGCDGFIVSDGNDFEQTVTMHKYYKTHAETLAVSLKAGIDCFTDAAELVKSAARQALNNNLITESDIDKALFNIFKVRFRLGEFDEDNPYSNIPEDTLCSPKHAELSLEAARKSVVLLKNDSFLPLDKNKVQKALVVGDIAKKMTPGWYEGTPPSESTVLNAIREELVGKDVLYDSLNDTISFFNEETGGYIAVNTDGSLRCDASYEKRSLFIETNWGFGSFTYLETSLNKYLAVQVNGDKPGGADGGTGNKIPGTLAVTSDSVYGWFTMELFIYDENSEYFIHTGSGTKWKKNYEEDGIERAVNAAKDADVVFIVMGNHPLINGRESFDRTDIAFPKRWTVAIERLTNVNKNAALIIAAGYPYAICNEEQMVRAALYTGQGRQSIGCAVSDCLFGKFSPSGRLSMTWFKSVSDLPDINDYDIIGKRTYMYYKGKPLYPFGYGLSFSNFEYSNIEISKNTAVKGESIKVSFTVKNIGKYQSDEVPQMYAAMINPSVTRPQKQLVGFSRISLLSGESKKVEFELNISELEFFDIYSDKPIIESGDYTLFIGASSEDIRLKTDFKVTADSVVPRDMSFVCAENYDNAENLTLLEDNYRHTCVGSLGDGYAEYLNCGFTGNESKLHIRFGDGSTGKIEFYIDGIFTAEFETEKAVNYADSSGVSVKCGSKSVTVKFYGIGKLRDFSFE